MLLAPARLERRDLRGPSRGLSTRSHQLEDLGAAPGEVIDDRARDAGDIRRAALHRVPADVEPLGQLRAEDGLVEEAAGLRVLVEQPAVQCGPAPVGAERRVGDHDVRVQLRITGARRAVLERRSDEPAAVDHGRAAAAAACLARRALHVAERLGHRGRVCSPDLAGDVLVGDAEEDAYALRRTERQVEAGDAARGGWLAQSIAGAWVARVEQANDRRLIDLTGEPERLGAAAHPCAGRLARAGVVVLGAVRDLVEVVEAGGGSGGDLPDVQHPCRPRRARRRSPRPAFRAPGAGSM